ncbi:hypothetical protein AOLI_G00302870 [Acnodon oligacanthus]
MEAACGAAGAQSSDCQEPANGAVALGGHRGRSPILIPPHASSPGSAEDLSSRSPSPLREDLEFPTLPSHPCFEKTWSTPTLLSYPQLKKDQSSSSPFPFHSIADDLAKPWLCFIKLNQVESEQPLDYITPIIPTDGKKLKFLRIGSFARKT